MHAVANTEFIFNKSTDFLADAASDIKYPSVKAVADRLATIPTVPTLTAGSIPFSNGTTLAQDNNNLFWDNANKRLGLVTKTPLRSLHVVGVTPVLSNVNAYNGAIIENSDNVQLVLATGANKEAVLSFGDPGNNNIGQIAYSNTTDSMRFKVNNIDRLTITSNGYAGFGTTPSTPLHAKAPAGVNNVTRFESQTASNWNQFVSTAGTGEYGIWNDRFYFQNISTTGGIGFYGSNVNRVDLAIATSGNVGVGTGSSGPTETLQVGTANENATNRKALLFGVGGYASPGAFGINSNGDKIIFYKGADYDGRFGVSAGAEVWTKSVSSLGGAFGSLSYYTGNAGNAMGLRLNLGAGGGFALGGTITSYSNYTGATIVGLANKNVGFGTLTPAVQVQVTGGTSATYTGVTSGVGLQSNSSGSGFITANNVTPADPSASTISNGANFGFNGSVNNFYGMGLAALRDSAYDMWFQTGAQNGGGYRWYTAGAGAITERMTLTKAGRLSVGTPSPTSNLHVTGLPTYADNTAALAGGMTAGAFYRTATGELRVTY